MIVGIIVLVVIVLLALVFVGMYNGLVKLRNRVQEAWAQIDVELKRRHDLIGNLVETVKGYAAHEKGTLEEITRARAGAMAPGQGPADTAQSEAALTQALVRLNAVAEAYPDLKANQNFLALQTELGATEDRIASARRYYNANVRAEHQGRDGPDDLHRPHGGRRQGRVLRGRGHRAFGTAGQLRHRLARARSCGRPGLAACPTGVGDTPGRPRRGASQHRTTPSLTGTPRHVPAPPGTS